MLSWLWLIISLATTLFTDLLLWRTWGGSGLGLEHGYSIERGLTWLWLEAMWLLNRVHRF